MPQRKYARPDFLPSNVDQARYEKWLRGRALAHFRRDRARGNTKVTNAAYKMAIHQAVLDSNGRDYYTDEPLDWSLLGRWNNVEAKAQRRKYKAEFTRLPSIDHVGDGLGAADFKLCTWRTNDAKSDLSHDQFVALCRSVVKHFDRSNR